MIEHSELVEEMERVEKMPIADRIKLAQKRRRQQLNHYSKWAKTELPQDCMERKQGIVFSAGVQLMDAAARGAYDEMLHLLKTGVDPNLKNHDGLTALHQCCIDGSTEMVKLLLQYGAQVNVTDNDLWTPLHAAATCGHLQVVTELVRAGAHLTAVNGDGDMPHDITEEEVTLQYLENEMIKQGIDEATIEKIRNEKHNTLLVHVSTILSSGGDINQPVDQGGTFLHVAIAHSFNDIMQLLLEAKADATIADWDGWQPIHVAVYWGNEEAVELLASNPTVNLKATTKLGETPYELCDDPNIKYRLIQLLNEWSNAPEHIYETLESSEDHATAKQLQTDHDQELNKIDHFSQPDQQDSTNLNSEDIPASPLVNIELSSDRRNSIKEAKHLAPIKRMNSVRSSNSEKRRVSGDSHPLAQKSKATEMSEIDIPPNPSGISSLSQYYDIVPAVITYPPSPQESFYVEPLSKINDRKQSGTTASETDDQHEENLIAQINQPRTNENKKELQGEVKEDNKEEKHEAKEDKMEGKDANIGSAVLIRVRKKQAPPPPRGTLMDLKMQRQSLREEEGEHGRGEARSTSTFYQSLPTLDARMYEAPPSPSTIRYHFKMVDDDNTPTRLIIKQQKKCAIM